MAIALASDAQALLTMMAESGLPPYEQMTPEQAREILAQAGPAMAFPKAEVGSVEDISADGPAGPLGLRLYKPARTAAQPSPALLYFHGGGWMLGNLESHDDICRRFCDLLDMPVLAVDYRLAPEHPFPAAVDDSLAAARWLFDHAETLGIDPRRIAVGGDSAGGNLAAVAALASARGQLPPFAYQLLFYPVTDVGEESAGYARVAEGVPLTGATMRWFREAYLADPAHGQDWRASPLRADTLAGTPPAFVITMHHDPLAEEGIAYARRLADDGVTVTHLHYSHHLHGILSMGAMMREAEGALRSASAALKAHLSTGQA
jgi:acetyl esterase